MDHGQKKRLLMRDFILIASLLLAVEAQAQVLIPSPPPPAVNQVGMRDFCIYGNQIYSLGAELCVASSNTEMRCVASDVPEAPAKPAPAGG